MLVAANYGTVADIEIIWCLIALIGIGFGIFNLRDAWGDRTFVVERDIYNGRRMIANYALRSEIMRIVVQIIFLSIGIIALFLPDAPDNSLTRTQTIAGFLIRQGLVISSILILGKSIDSYITRHKIIHQGDEHGNTSGNPGS